MQVRIIGLPPDAEPSPVEHLMSFSHIDGDTMVYRYLGEKDSATRPEQGHAHDPSSFLLTCGACITDARERFHRLDEAHDEFVNVMLENAPESYDEDASADAIAVTYIRDLETIRDRTLGALNQLSIVTENLLADAGPAIALKAALRFVARFKQDIRMKARLVDQQDAEHIHGDGAQCFPGCAAYDIAKAEWEASRELDASPLYTWDQAGADVRTFRQRIIQQLLDKGVMYR